MVDDVKILSIVKVEDYNKLGYYDIDVVESAVGERLSANKERVGGDVMPIAYFWQKKWGDFYKTGFESRRK